MTKEVRYIIENHKYKTELSEYFVFGFALICLVTFIIIGLGFTIYGEAVNEKFTGLVIGTLACYLTINLITRFRQLNKFETVETNKSKEDNFQLISRLIKKLEPVDIEYDWDNLHINVKVPNDRLQRFPTWLTIVTLDNIFLINERPEILGLPFWRRTSIKKIITLINEDNG
jgi:hypothetical protein